jgi:lysyl-tRNA synthetase class 2
MQTVRDWFRERGFVEADTPLLVASGAVEPALDPFAVRGRHFTGQLPTSPEFQLKRLLSEYDADLFEISRAFRDEPVSATHQPEFAMLEWYRSGRDYEALMEDCDGLLRTLGDWMAVRFPENRSLPELFRLEYATVEAVFRRHANLELADFLPPAPADRLIAEARRRGHLSAAPAGWDDAYFSIFLAEIEGKLGRSGPLLLHDYPAAQAALARLKPDNQRWAERVELYLNGVELGNGFSELTDAAEQRRRVNHANAEREARGEPTHPAPQNLFAALDRGLPPCAGMAIGLDRLYLLITGCGSLGDVRFLPHE